MSSKWQIFVFFCPEWEHFGLYQVSSSNWIRLLKLISLVNVWPCAGLKGLIRPGTWRPPPPPGVIVLGCAWRTRTDGSRRILCEQSFSIKNFKFNVTPRWTIVVHTIHFFSFFKKYFAPSQNLEYYLFNKDRFLQCASSRPRSRSVRFVLLTIIKWFSPLLPDGAWEIVKDPAICVCDQ